MSGQMGIQITFTLPAIIPASKALFHGKKTFRSLGFYPSHPLSARCEDSFSTHNYFPLAQ